jgi:hypothetical protein
MFLRALLALLVLVAPGISAARCAWCCLGAPGTVEAPAEKAEPASGCCAKTPRNLAAPVSDLVFEHAVMPVDDSQPLCDCGTLDAAKERDASRAAAGDMLAAPRPAWDGVIAHRIQRFVKTVNDHAPPRAPVIVAMRC